MNRIQNGLLLWLIVGALLLMVSAPATSPPASAQQPRPTLTPTPEIIPSPTAMPPEESTPVSQPPETAPRRRPCPLRARPFCPSLATG